MIYSWIKTIIKRRWKFNNLLSENPFDFHVVTLLETVNILNIFRLLETLNSFTCQYLQNDSYRGNNLNETLEVSPLCLALLLILHLLLML